jgi:Polyketide cyclase / dehydrase and lipid transport
MTATVEVVTDVAIRRPVQAVAEYAANPDNAPSWYVNIKSVEWQTSPPLAVGSRVSFVAQFLGRRLAYTYQVTELALPERLVMTTSEGPFPMETSYEWQPLPDGGTRMVLRNRGTPAGFSRWLAPFMATAMRRANRKDLALLKAILERGLA